MSLMRPSKAVLRIRSAMFHSCLVASSASFGLALPERRRVLSQDLLCRARTGSGKTLAYAVPLIQRLLTEACLIARLCCFIRALLSRRQWSGCAICASGAIAHTAPSSVVAEARLPKFVPLSHARFDREGSFGVRAALEQLAPRQRPTVARSAPEGGVSERRRLRAARAPHSRRTGSRPCVCAESATSLRHPTINLRHSLFAQRRRR